MEIYIGEEIVVLHWGRDSRVDVIGFVVIVGSVDC